MYFLEFSNWIPTSSQEVRVPEAWLAPTLFPTARLFRVSGSVTLCNVINAAVWSSGHYSLCCALLWLLDNTATSHDLLSSCPVCCAGSLTAAPFSVSLCCDGLRRIVTTRFWICLGRELSPEKFLTMSMQYLLDWDHSLLEKIPSSQDGAGIRQASGSDSKSRSFSIKA